MFIARPGQFLITFLIWTVQIGKSLRNMAGRPETGHKNINDQGVLNVREWIAPMKSF